MRWPTGSGTTSSGGWAQIEAELERLERELMAHEAEVFEAALEHDLIGPEDFL